MLFVNHDKDHLNNFCEGPMFILILNFFSCNDEEAKDSASSEEPPVTEDTGLVTEDTGPLEHPYHGCPGQAVEQCEDFSHCTSIYASPLIINAEEECWTLSETEYVGCRDNDEPAGNSEEFARPSEAEECYYFPTTLVPDGWISCDEILEQECSAE